MDATEIIRLSRLQERFLVDVANEADKAVSKFPDSVHSLAALMEEVGELAQAMLHCEYEPQKHTPGSIRSEAIQVAVMAMRIATEGDRTFETSFHTHTFKAAQ